MQSYIFILIILITIKGYSFLDKTSNSTTNNIINNEDIKLKIISKVQERLNDCYIMDMDDCTIYMPHVETNLLAQTLIYLKYTDFKIKNNKITVLFSQHKECIKEFKKYNFQVSDFLHPTAFGDQKWQKEANDLLKYKTIAISDYHIKKICAGDLTEINLPVINDVGEKKLLLNQIHLSTKIYLSDTLYNRIKLLISDLNKKDSLFKVKVAYESTRILHSTKQEVEIPYKIFIMKKN